MSKISAVVIAYNEEKNIRRCLESISWADEIVLVDSYSQDRTKEIAKAFTDKIYDLECEGFGRKKEFARTKTVYNWILSIDADEVVSVRLREEIKRIVREDEALDGYYIPRLSNFLGKWIRYGGWYPDYVLRLFRKDKAKFDQSLVHEKLVLEGKTGRLKNELLHYTDPTISHYLLKMNKYTTLGAKMLLDEGKRATFFDMLIRPPALFLKMFIVKFGFLDGWYGYLLAILSSFHVLLKYAKLWNLNKPRASQEKST